MTDTPDSAASLDDWLRYIGSVHPRSIELGLERGQAVLTRMALGKLHFYVLAKRLTPTAAIDVLSGAGGRPPGSEAEFPLQASEYEQILTLKGFTPLHIQLPLDGFRERFIRLNSMTKSRPSTPSKDEVHLPSVHEKYRGGRVCV